jgi:ATP-binding protein involved in chromosome partitioning
MTIEEQIKEKLKEVKDPEFGKSIMERNLIDEVRVENDTAHILFHLTVPFCPDVFALYIGREIKKKAKEVQGINKVRVTLQNHQRAEQLNQILGHESA